MTWALTPVLLAVTSLPPGNAAIVVAYESGVDAYAEALEGMGAALGPQNLRVVDLHAAGADLTRALSLRDVQLVIAVGSRALAEVQSRKASMPVIATMILHGGEGEVSAHVDLEIPLSAQFQAMNANSALLKMISTLVARRNSPWARRSPTFLAII